MVFSRSAIVLAAKVIVVSSANILGEDKLRIGVVQGYYPVGRHKKLGQDSKIGHLWCIFCFGRKDAIETICDYSCQHHIHKASV